MTQVRMAELLATLGPEIALGVGACLCLVVGLWSRADVRRLAPAIAALALLASAVLALAGGAGPGPAGALTGFVRPAVALVGLLLLMVAWSLPDHLRTTRDAEAAAERGEPFEPGNVVRGEFFAFFLCSLAGVMLCAGANDLVWLFLALELTSLPTYVMVAISRDRRDAQEAAVKYFFLGAMAAAVFLYGFALIYGASGTTVFHSTEAGGPSIAAYVAEVRAEGLDLPPLFVAGLLLALTGLAFKIAAVPMHFYVADVYQGAATPVTAFLAFVPKTAGFVSMMLLLGLVGRPLPAPVLWLLWWMAALTMTVGNVLGLLQSNVKRMLAYSSIAHSGYILVGLLAGPSIVRSDVLGHGPAAVLFYLVAYGLATVGAFAVLGCLRAGNDEAQELDDIAGLAGRQPALAATLLLSVLSLMGLPPLIGFLGKVHLFGAAIRHEDVGLVVIAVLNSAIAAVYYLRIVGACYFGQDQQRVVVPALPARRLGASLAVGAALLLGVAGGRVIDAAAEATPTAVADPGHGPAGISSVRGDGDSRGLR